MPDVSLHGRAAPKHRTINVEANLLSQRLQERFRAKESLQRRLLVAVVAVALIVIALPPLYRLQKAAAMRYDTLLIENRLATQRLQDVQKRQDTVKPFLQNQKAVSAFHRHSHEVLGQVTLFFNDVQPSMSLGGLTATVDTGVIDFSTTAAATDYNVAAEFVNLITKSPNSRQTILSSMTSNHALGSNGVSFQLEQKIGVGP